MPSLPPASGPGHGLPAVIEPDVQPCAALDWFRHNKVAIERTLSERGGVLFRSFNLEPNENYLISILKALSYDPIRYELQSTPRSHVSGNVYTSTEYPCEQTIPLHNELSYSSRWPAKIFFFCVKPADHGGETPIANSVDVFQGIPAEIRKTFLEKGVMYVRNYHHRIDIPWQKAFGASTKTGVAEYCREHNISFEWIREDQLRTWQVLPAVRSHPKLTSYVWFNQAHLFHWSSLPAQTQAVLRGSFDEADMPRNCYYGDGNPIPVPDLDAVRASYAKASQSFHWHEGDLLLLDNMLVAHGRQPFQGSRRILVAMAEPMEAKDSQFSNISVK
jgi:alpha-ketoglutarate-dependent taurine dioxygenase